jgi:hypothetical protein
MSGPVSSAIGANSLSARTDLKEIVARAVRESRAPTTADKLYAIGTSWVDSVNRRAYILVAVDSGLADWQQTAGT